MTTILGIETSCDETAVAVVKDGNNVLSNTVRTQDIHNQYGGVVPDISSREHARFIDRVFKAALDSAGITVNDIDAIAVVNGPGLIGSLMAGVMFAKGLSIASGIPLIGVDHVLAHMYAARLSGSNPPFPFIALAVSGGHTSLFHVEEGYNAILEGHTVDDAAGEAFDKCAKMLGLGYPGGPAIDRESENGNAAFHQFPVAEAGGYNYSFSGLKTSVLYYLNSKDEEFIKIHMKDIAASIQEAIVQQLIGKAVSLIKDTSVKTLVLAGGVSANTRLRERFIEAASQYGFECFVPDIAYCTDNAANAAGLGFVKYNERKNDLEMNVYSRMK